MRKTGKSKVDAEALETSAAVKPSEEADTNGEASNEEDRPVSPASSPSKRLKRKSKGKSDDSRKRKKLAAEDVEEDVAEEEVEEPAVKMEENGDASDVEDAPLSKKMKKKAAKPTPVKVDNSKRKKRAAELEEKEEYEVESVVGSRLQRGKRQFRIRWKGFTAEDDTWEAEEGLTCPEAIKLYLDANPEEDETQDTPSVSKGGKGGKAKAVDKKKKIIKKAKDEDEDDKEESTKEEYEVDRVIDIFIKKNGKREFLIRWKGYGTKDNTWEPEEHLNCPELIEKFMRKVDDAKQTSGKELRASRTHTDRFTLTMAGSGRRISRRGEGKQRARYHDAE